MSFQPFSSITGVAAPLLRASVDTDVIIRIERLTTRSPEELGRHAFEVLRYRPDGSDDPSFALNRPCFRGAVILIAGPNFGCGSSREPAVWALMGLGIRCVLAPSFGDIFFNNCFQNGVLPVVLPSEQIDALATQAEAGATMTVNLQRQEITPAGGATLHFDVDPRSRQALLEGLDEIDVTLKEDAAILAWQAKDRVVRPWAWQTVERSPR